MRRPETREIILIASTISLIGLIAVGTTLNPDSTDTVNATEWQQIEIEDVNSGETYTVEELEKPLLVETFAVWCPTCTNQQNEIKEFHEESNVKSVSLDVDSNEDESQIKRHTEENSFNWRYSISPPELTRKLVNQYGTTIANPPSAPVILVCEEGSRRLGNGVKSATKLEEEVEKGC